MSIRKFFNLQTLVFILVLSSFSISMKAQTQDPKPFQIIIENTDNGITLYSKAESTWTKLSFKTNDDQPQAINQFGMAKLNKPDDRSSYLFTISKNNNQIILKGIKGTSWKELKFYLSKNNKQTVDQSGVFQ